MGRPEWIPQSAAGYDARVQAERGLYYERYGDLLARVVAEARCAPGKYVLEIGAGTGELTRRLCATGARVLAVDPSAAMLAAARAKAAAPNWPTDSPEVTFLEQDDPFLHLPAGPFDAIVSTYAFHHVEPELHEHAITGIARALVPGGRFVLGDVVFDTQDELEAALIAHAELERECFALRSTLLPLFARCGLAYAEIRIGRATRVVTGLRPADA